MRPVQSLRQDRRRRLGTSRSSFRTPCSCRLADRRRLRWRTSRAKRMPSPIVLPPSLDRNALVRAIGQATASDRTLLLTATFLDCEYEAGFGSANSPKTKVAVVQERGTWTFAKEDFRNRDPSKAILKGPQPDVIL